MLKAEGRFQYYREFYFIRHRRCHVESVAYIHGRSHFYFVLIFLGVGQIFEFVEWSDHFPGLIHGPGCLNKDVTMARYTTPLGTAGNDSTISRI